MARFIAFSERPAQGKLHLPRRSDGAEAPARQTLDEFLDDFPTVTREVAIAALEYAKSLPDFPRQVEPARRLVAAPVSLPLDCPAYTWIVVR